MRIFQSLSLLVVLAVCYMLFFRSQIPAAGVRSSAPAEKTDGMIPEEASLVKSSQAHSEYKRDIDRAREVAHQMKASHDEANSF